MKIMRTIENQKPIVALFSTGHSWSFPLCDLLRVFYPGYQIHHVEQQVMSPEVDTFVTSLESEYECSYYSHYDLRSGELCTGKVGQSGRSMQLGFDIVEFDRGQKNTIKRELYEILALEYGALPWGMLTGVRPSSLLFHSDQIEMSFEEQIIYLQEHYCVSKSRAELAAEVAQIEYPIMEHAADAFSLYIHIPFCPTRCDYCSFPTLLSANRKDEIAAYAEKLIWEMHEMKQAYEDRKLQNIYVGGGTPATMSVTDLEKVLKEAKRCFDISELKEVTVEVGRPELVCVELLSMLVSQGVNRISINPQTMQQDILNRIGRGHSVDDVYRAFSIARNFPSLAVNLDLIIGLPGDDLDSFRDTLLKVEELQPENLTMHTMSIKKGSVYGQVGVAAFIDELSRIQEMCDTGRAFAKQHGYQPYYLYRQKNMIAPLENVGYSKPGYVNHYNILMMEERHFVLGIGMGATSKFPNSVTNGVKTILNYRNLRDYMGKSNVKIIERQRAMREIVY